jgi:predicted ATPase
VDAPRLVVISGGPGAGKTTLLLELERRGFRFAAEVARQIIREQMRDGGNALPWGDRERYCRLMLEGSIASYEKYAASTETTFFDRGIPDTLCYARLIGSPMEDEIRVVCDKYRYMAQVFLAPPWQEIYATDAERKQTYDEVVKTYHLMGETYRDCGYEVVEIPRMTPAQRADFIVNALAAHL